jgi:glycosyltransferase involved in cell wall biosynthesis
MRPLKIALLSRWYWEENRRVATLEGGPTQQLAEAVAALGHEVVVLSQSPKVEELTRSQIGTLEVWLSPREKRGEFFTALRDKWAKHTYRHRKVHTDAIDLAEFLEKRGPFDVLWAHCEEPDGLVAAIAAKNGVALPPVLTEIFALRYRFQDGLPVFNEQPALRLAFRHATRLIAHSDLVAKSMAAYASAGLTVEQLAAKTRVVHHNLRHEFLRVAAQVETNLPPEPDRVLFLGALNEKKGALVFLDAISQTEAAKSGVTFVVAGDFTEKNPRFTQRWEEALESAQSALPRGHLELLGKIPLDDTIRQIQRATLVVFPSLFDEYSRALVEALILGRPVVTTKNVGAWPLVAEHVCGLVVEPNDSAALAEAIDAVLDPDTHYAANARHLAHRLLHEVSPEVIARQMTHHFEEIALPPPAVPKP